MIQLELGANLEEVAMLLRRAEAHDVLDAGPVVPAAVEDDDLTRRREVSDIALQIQLTLLAVGRRRQRHYPEHARANPFGDSLDRAALARGVATLEDYDDPQAVVPDPVLQRAKLDLQLAQRLFVFLALHRSSLCQASGGLPDAFRSDSAKRHAW